MRIEVLRVTPEMAQRFLDNASKNRKVRWNVVKRYAHDMALGAWRSDTNESISFNAEDQMIDGQHRCHAVILHGKPVDMVIVHGAKTHLGRGTNRDLRDVMQLIYNTEITYNEQAIVRALYPSARYKLTDIDVLDLYQKYQQAISFAASQLPHKQYLGLAGVGAALARAYYHEDRHMLSEFMRVFATGISESPFEKPPALLNQWLQRTKGGTRGGSSKQLEVMLHTERAIEAYCAGRPISILIPAKEDIYPLPEMKTEAAVDAR